MIATDALRVRRGDFTLEDVSISLPTGAWGIVLGPAGAGKTTLLEAIAGVRAATSGQVLLRGADVTGVPPERRRIGVAWQHGYLFPHLGVEANVRYGARDDASVAEVVDRLSVAPLFGRPVRSLSGGERQLVALARALAPAPDVLLLDEPFAAMDPRTRVRVRRAVHALQRERGLTVLQVTHDFAEAGTLGDVAIVLEGGRVVQVDEPARLFRHPASGAVAEFLGAENVYAGEIVRVAEAGGGEGLRFRGEGLELVGVGEVEPGAGHAVVRGEEVIVSREPPGPSSVRNVFAGRVEEVATEGMLARVALRVGVAPLTAVMTRASADALGLAPGVAVVASVKATAVHLC